MSFAILEPFRVGFVFDRTFIHFKALNFVHKQPLLLMDGLNSVIGLLSFPLPGLHLLLSVWTPMLMEVVHLLLGVLEGLLQLIDLPLLLPILCQVPSDLVLQRLLMLVHPIVEDLLLNLPEMIVIVTIDSLIIRDELYPVPYHRDMLL